MKQIIIIFFFSFMLGQSIAQDTLRLTLYEAVSLAREQSPQAIAARHQYRASYWNWHSHQANYLPSITLDTYTSLNRSISSITLPDGTDNYVHRNQLLNDGAITINQNVPLLGGSIYMKTGLQRLDLFSDNNLSYKSTPVVLGYSQNLLGYNHLKWNKKTEPIRYSQSQKAYTETQELVAATAAMKFYQLALAQNSWQSAAYNYAAADTLYQYAEGRYNIGTITENEMLQLEINFLLEQTNMMNSRIEMDNMILDLRSFLGITDNIEIEVIVNDDIPNFKANVEEAVYYAHENSPDIEYYTLRELESESAVARAKASRGLKADLYVEFGLSQTNSHFRDAYRNPLDQQLVSLGIRIPILDWGVGKGQVEVAKSNLEKVKIDIQQARTDFEANVIKMIKQFNLQVGKVEIAYKTADRAVRRNSVAYRLYLLGKSSVLDLNAAVAEKDRAQQAYIRELQNYWSLYYGIRSITGYDFETGRMIISAEENFN